MVTTMTEALLLGRWNIEIGGSGVALLVAHIIHSHGRHRRTKCENWKEYFYFVESSQTILNRLCRLKTKCDARMFQAKYFGFLGFSEEMSGRFACDPDDSRYSFTQVGCTTRLLLRKSDSDLCSARNEIPALSPVLSIKEKRIAIMADVVSQNPFCQ